jgi:pimeloyl-ACP methyl ester carboxylesterase
MACRTRSFRAIWAIVDVVIRSWLEDEMNGTRHMVGGSGGVPIGLLTAGSGPPLLLVHGGFGQIERWEPVWKELTDRWQVTAMDRRGRGTSGDSDGYGIVQEYGDISLVVEWMVRETGNEVDVFAHSYGATCALGAAAAGAPVRHLVAYEPAGPETVSQAWVDRSTALVESDQVGRAMFSFLTEIIGLSSSDVEALRTAPSAYDILEVVRETMPREAAALRTVDLVAEARKVRCPVTLFVGTESPRWAHLIADAIADVTHMIEIVPLAAVGHEAIDRAPHQLVEELERRLQRN